MSKAEEIAKGLDKDHQLFYKDAKNAGWNNLIDEIAEAYAQSQLYELREEVEVSYNKWNDLAKQNEELYGVDNESEIAILKAYMRRDLWFLHLIDQLQKD